MTTNLDFLGAETCSARDVDETRGASWEQSLVRRMVEGSEGAFDEFADEYLSRLYRFAALRLRGRDPSGELARDIVQTTLCKAIQKIASFRGEASLFTWLCSCCRNEILMHYRKSERRNVHVEWGEVDEGWLDSSEGTLEPDQDFSAKERSNLVHRALDELPSKYSHALEWKYVERVSVQEIADRLAVGVKAAESLLTRARKAFKRSFEAVTQIETQIETQPKGSTQGPHAMQRLRR